MIFLTNLGLGIFLVLIGFILIIILWFIGTMNRLRHYGLKVQEAESGIDVALTKRYDLLTKMLEATKGYAKHESETLEKIVKWRGGIPNNASLEDKEEFTKQLREVSSGIDVVVEQYPDLKTNTVFKELQAAMVNTEDHLQAARRLYNANVTQLNHLIVSFPQSIVANSIHLEQRPYFETEERKRKDVEIKF
jgi:LemA protein